MGHQPGDGACDIVDPNHAGRCRSIVVGPVPADLDKTRYFQVASDVAGRPLSYWRTNVTAPGVQVEFRHPGGKWEPSLVFATEAALERSLRRFEDRLPWREITAGEVPS